MSFRLLALAAAVGALAGIVWVRGRYERAKRNIQLPNASAPTHPPATITCASPPSRAELQPRPPPAAVPVANANKDGALDAPMTHANESFPETTPDAQAVDHSDELILKAVVLPESSPLEPIISAGRGRAFAVKKSYSVAEGARVLAVRPDVWAPSWPCDAAELRAAEIATCQCDSGSGSSLLSSAGELSESWLAGEIQALWLLAARTALLSREKPSLFAALLSLNHHSDVRPAAAQRVVRAAASRLAAALARGCSLELPAATLCKLFGVLLTNAFGIRAAGETRRLDMRASSFALSLLASLFNHSCLPNVHTDFMLSKEGVEVSEGSSEDCGSGLLIFRASRQLAGGEEALLSYISSEEPTYVRQAELRRSKHFTCTCELCEDPCEKGRCGSFFRCRRCLNGWQGWQRDGAADELSSWRCGACGQATPHAEMIRWDEEFRERIASCLAGSAGKIEATLRTLIEDALLRCHPNHALLLQCRLALVAFGFDDEGDSGRGGHLARGAGSIVRKLAAAEDALLLAERILPAHDAQKGDLLFQIGLGRHTLAQAALRSAATERERARALLRASAEAFLTGAVQFAAVLSAGERAGPACAARQFAQLSMKQLGELCHRA